MDPYQANQTPWIGPPPTQPYIPQRIAQSGWPVAFGVIAIVLGGLGLLIYGLGAVGNLFIAKFSELNGEGAPAMFHGLVEWKGWLLAVALGATALSALLLIGGIGLLGRRRWAVTLLMIWAVAKFLYVPPYTAVNYQAQKVQMAAMAQQMQEEMAKQQQPGQPAIPAGTFDTFFQLGMMLGLVVSVAWGWALPVVLFIWLMRRRIREEVATWP